MLTYQKVYIQCILYAMHKINKKTRAAFIKQQVLANYKKMTIFNKELSESPSRVIIYKLSSLRHLLLSVYDIALKLLICAVLQKLKGININIIQLKGNLLCINYPFVYIEYATKNALALNLIQIRLSGT